LVLVVLRPTVSVEPRGHDIESCVGSRPFQVRVTLQLTISPLVFHGLEPLSVRQLRV